jgi:hypothetical protein
VKVPWSFQRRNLGQDPRSARLSARGIMEERLDLVSRPSTQVIVRAI